MVHSECALGGGVLRCPVVPQRCGQCGGPSGAWVCPEVIDTACVEVGWRLLHEEEQASACPGYGIEQSGVGKSG